MNRIQLISLLIATTTIMIFGLSIAAQTGSSLPQKPITLKHWMTPEEAELKRNTHRDFQPTDPPQGPVTNIAEFNRMQSVLIRYSFGITYQVIAEMSQDCNVTTIVLNQSEETYVRNKYTQNGVNLDHCDFIWAPSDSYWTRDYGPWFVVDGNDEFGIVDFPYNRPRPQDDEIPVKVAQHLGINLFGMNVEHTGGNYMTDGMGISSSTDLVWVENPGLTHTQIAQMFQNYLGINTYHVVPDPNNTYIDHIDCWGKFLDVDKVLIRSVPTTHPQYDEIEATAAYYASQTSSYGTPYQVFRVNTPNNQPYTNSLILNRKVLVPIMNSQYDAQAIAAYQQAMPGYEVLGFTGTWESTDALHCRAIGIADIGMLHIRHVALSGEQPVQASYQVQADIRALSGQPLYNDSVILYYRYNQAAWQAVNMTNTSAVTWTGNIPGTQPGSQIDYYIYAADHSGRRETHPFIGTPDPHSFSVGEQAFPHIIIYPESLEVQAMVGEIVYTDFSISNVGDLELYYTVTTSTAVFGDTSYPVPNSPSATSFNYNTYTEAGWTNLVIDKTGEISNWQIQYTWSSDNWPEEGSFHVESPAGTQAVIASANPSGTYTVDLTTFNGEDMAGIWKIWIEDTYGDGGHQATNITTTFTTIVSEIPWLPTGIVMSGTLFPTQTCFVSIPCSALQLEPGVYLGTIIVESNDPDYPVIEIPVNFEVTELADITVTPDSLYFLTMDDMINGKTFTISNMTDSDILINEITEWGSTVPFMIEPPAPALPYNLVSGEELTLNVLIPIPPDKRYNMIYDNLNVTSQYGTHTVVIAWDSDIMPDPVTTNPDTLWFTDPSSIGVPATYSVTNNTPTNITLEQVVANWQNWVPVPLPYEMEPGETVEMNITVIGVDETIGYDSIMIHTSYGINKIMMVLDWDLISAVDESRPGFFTAYPNPFHDIITITFNNPTSREVEIDLTDLNGKFICRVHYGFLTSGMHRLTWNANTAGSTGLKNGIYFLRVKSGDEVKMIKVVKLK